MEPFGQDACFHSLSLAHIDFYRACVVDGLGHVVHENLFAVKSEDEPWDDIDLDK